MVTLVCFILAMQQPATPPQPPRDQPPASPQPPEATPPQGQPAAPTQPPATEMPEPVDDISIPAPGDLGLNVDAVQRDPSNWFGIPPDKEWLNFVRDPLKKLDKEYGLSITGAYTVLFQQSAGPNAHGAGAGDFDLVGRWTPIGRGTKDTGSFYVATEYRHNIGNLTPAELGPEIGTLLGTANGFNDRGWAVKDAYYVQRLFEDKFRIGLGRIDPENIFANLKLQSSNTSFLNKAFSTNPAVAFPGIGGGAAAMIKPVDWLYVGGGATNAYGNTTTFEDDLLFEEGRFFKFGEVGFVPKIEGWGEGRYRIAPWHFDSRSLTNKPADEGISLLADQEIGKDVSVFARYGYSDATLTNVRHLIEGGVGWQGLFGSTADLTGLAAAYAEPRGGGQAEKVVEVFHRAQLTGRIQLTLGAQVILDPSNAPTTDVLGVFSLRVRLSF